MANNNYQTKKCDPQIPETSVNLLTERDSQKDYYYVPTSQAIATFFKVLSLGSSLDALPHREKKVSHSQTIELKINGNKREVTVSSNNCTVTISIEDINLINGTNKALKKMFIFLLLKINEQAYNRENLRRNYIQFSLDELMNVGCYNSPQSARRGFKSSMNILRGVKFKGEAKKGKKKTYRQTELEPLWGEATVKNSTCTVYLNERINWAFVLGYYTILPKCFFSAPNRTIDLLFYIFYCARQNTKRIKENKYFSISLRALQLQLNLPDAKGNRNPEAMRRVQILSGLLVCPKCGRKLNCNGRSRVPYWFALKMNAACKLRSKLCLR